MATHSANALLDHPDSAGTARPAAELIESFGVALPTTSDAAPRHSAPATAQPGLVPGPRRSDEPTQLLEGPPPAGLSRALPIPRRSGQFLSSATTRQGVVAAASVTVLGATAAIAAVTSSAPAAGETTAELSAFSHTTTLPVQPAAPFVAAPDAPLASGYGAATRKVTDALPAALHRAEATQIIEASRIQRNRATQAAAQAAGHTAGNAARAGSGSGGSGGGAAPVTVAGSGKGVSALNAALTQRGKPYVWGAAGPSAFDCSGLVLWAFKQVGISLPHSSAAQSKMGTPVSRDDLQPGDLVFFYSPVSHVGIYAGNGQVINATTSGQPVKLSNISAMPFNSARRL